VALITCMECQKEVSDAAPRCIHCGGYPSKAQAGADAGSLMGQVLVLLALGAGVFYFVYEYVVAGG
jgi:hypothetical protein